ncbi:MAG: hypothetical protein R3332_00445 [Pseudohongiellaceae bacterium]|nr:hypothetical protein [Pseudohongiellaceae bacterium]
MTTKWNITKEWDGETVAVLGAGPDMTKELAETAKGSKTIAVNRAVKFAPWADMFVALDPHHPFWKEADNVGFTGKRVCGVECDIDALYGGMFYEKVKISQVHTIDIRNNALAAIRIAALMGAKKIVLLGFDPERYEETHAHTGFFGLVQGLNQIIDELRATGIEIDRKDSEKQFPGTKPPRRSELMCEEAKIDKKAFPQQKIGKQSK